VPIAEIMRAYSTEAVEYARNKYAIHLDFSEASLDEVDRIIRERTGGDVLDVDKLTPKEQEDLWVLCKMIGGYVGEVIIRNIGGMWQLDGREAGRTKAKLLAGGKIESWPPDSVWRTLTEPYRGMAGYYRGLRAILGHGEERIEGGIKTTILPPLSTTPPKVGASDKPWWRFWRR